jgi:hypothetical protein
MKDGLFVLAVVCKKLLELKGEIVVHPSVSTFHFNYL